MIAIRKLADGSTKQFIGKNGNGEEDGVNKEEVVAILDEYLQQHKDDFKGDQGEQGIGGVAGFIPDYDRYQELTVTLGNKSIAEAAPDDGWIIFGSYINAADYLMLQVMLDNGTDMITVNGVAGRKGRNVFPPVPVKKGQKVQVWGYTSSTVCTSDTWARFIPVMRPNLLEERIVGYLGDEPVYEVIVEGKSPSKAGSSTPIIDVSSLNIKKMINLTGFLMSASGNQIPVCMYEASSTYTYFFHNTGGKAIQATVYSTNYLNRDVTLTLQYIKA